MVRRPHVEVNERRTAQGLTRRMYELVEVCYRDAETIRVVARPTSRVGLSGTATVRVPGDGRCDRPS